MTLGCNKKLNYATLCSLQKQVPGMLLYCQNSSTMLLYALQKYIPGVYFEYIELYTYAERYASTTDISLRMPRERTSSK